MRVTADFSTHTNNCKSTLTHCRICGLPILSKEQLFVAQRQQAAYSHIIKIHMQANNPNMGLEKYNLVTTKTAKWIRMADTLSDGCFCRHGLFLSNTATYFGIFNSKTNIPLEDNDRTQWIRSRTQTGLHVSNGGGGLVGSKCTCALLRKIWGRPYTWYT